MVGRPIQVYQLSSGDQALALPLPPPAPQALALQYKALGAINIAAIAATAIKGFEQGGIVGGNSFTGDKIPIRVNSGEMILNRQQQTNLFKASNEGSSGSSGLLEEIRSLRSDLLQQAINLSVDGRVLATAIRKEVLSGFRLT